VTLTTMERRDLFSVMLVIVLVVFLAAVILFTRYCFLKKEERFRQNVNGGVEEDPIYSASVSIPVGADGNGDDVYDNETPRDPVEELYPEGDDGTPLLEIDDDRYEEILKEEIRGAITERLLQEEADDMLSENIEYNLYHYVGNKINTAAAFTSSIDAIKSELDPKFTELKFGIDFEGAAARVLDAAFEGHSPRLETCLIEVDLQDFKDGVVKTTTPSDSGSPTYTYADKSLDVEKAAAAVKPGEVGLHIFFRMKKVADNEVVGRNRQRIFRDDKDLFELTFRNNLGYNVVLVRQGPSVDRIGGLRTNDKKQSGSYDEDKTPFYIPNGGIRTLGINASHTHGRLVDGDFRKVFFSFLTASLNRQNGSGD
jgi:hypothetical protein